jgi:hypothetical protein
MKKDYVATAICDGIKKHFTVHNVTEGRATKVAKDVARSLFCATCVSILSLTITS